MTDKILNNHSDKLSTKERISVETFRLLQNGALNVTINQICKATNITKSTFYYYYHSIDDVIDTFSDVLNRQLNDGIPLVFEQPTCVEQALMTIRLVDQAVTDLGPAVAAARYIMHLKKGDYPGFKVEAGWNMVNSIIKKGIDVGELPAKYTAEQISTSIYYIMRGVNHTWCMCGGSFNFVETVQTELRRYLENICKD